MHKSGAIGRPVGEHALFRSSQSVSWRYDGRCKKRRARKARPILLRCTDPSWGKPIGTLEKGPQSAGSFEEGRAKAVSQSPLGRAARSKDRAV